MAQSSGSSESSTRGESDSRCKARLEQERFIEATDGLDDNGGVCRLPRTGVKVGVPRLGEGEFRSAMVGD